MRIEDEKVIIKGREVLFRNATEEDAQILLDYLKVTCGETRYLVKEPHEITMTLEQEKEFINNSNDSDNSILLLGFLDGRHVGNCSLMGHFLRSLILKITLHVQQTDYLFHVTV